MRFHNSDKVSVHRAGVQCHSERSEESLKACRTRGFFVAPLTVGLLRMTGKIRPYEWTLAGIVLIVCFVLLGGCLGKGTQKDTRFYLLEPVYSMSSNEERALTEGEGVMLAIGPVRVREYLSRPEIVTRTRENNIVVHDFHSWGESLDRNFTVVLGANLSYLLSTDRIVFFPWRRRPNFDYQIVVDVMRFEGDLGGEASLLVHYYIWEVGEGEVEDRRMGTWKSSFSRQTQDDSYEALVATMSELVGDLSREIAEKIKNPSQ